MLLLIEFRLYYFHIFYIDFAKKLVSFDIRAELSIFLNREASQAPVLPLSHICPKSTNTTHLLSAHTQYQLHNLSSSQSRAKRFSPPITRSIFSHSPEKESRLCRTPTYKENLVMRLSQTFACSSIVTPSHPAEPLPRISSTLKSSHLPPSTPNDIDNILG